MCKKEKQMKRTDTVLIINERNLLEVVGEITVNDAIDELGLKSIDQFSKWLYTNKNGKFRGKYLLIEDC